MKKITVAAIIISAFTLTACHYGQTEAEKSLERNEQYKGDKADYSVNRAGEGGKMNEKPKAEAADTVLPAAPEAEKAPETGTEHH